MRIHLRFPIQFRNSLLLPCSRQNDYEEDENTAANEEIVNQYNVAVKEFNLLDEDNDG